MKQLILILLSIVFLASCDRDDPNKIFQEQLDVDVAEIQLFLSENNITATKDPSGVFYKIDEEGSGDHPSAGSFVSMAYEGRLMDGTVFDSASLTNPLKSFLYNLITGWQIGVPKFKKGGKGTLYIPSGYAYGTSGTSGIPGNSVLIFDVELLDFNEKKINLPDA